MNKELNWFEKHINWTWAIVTLVSRVITFSFLESVIAYILGYIMIIAVTAWGLWRKNRSGFWILIPFIVLLLKNKRNIVKDGEYNERVS